MLTEALTITKGDSQISASIDELLVDAVNGYHRKGTDMAQNVMEAVTNGRYSFKIVANENSAIANEWQSEVDMTKAMIKQAKTAFTKQSKEDGGIPKEVMDAFSDGRGVIFDGKPVVDGTFIKTESGALGVIKDGGLVIQEWHADGRTNATRLGSLRPPYVIILPGSPEYDATVTAAAQIDDAISTAGIALSDSLALVTFSALVPAVSQRRTTTTLMLCNARSTGLPAPYFTMVLNPALSGLGPVLAAIVASQASLVKGYKKGEYSHNTFTVEASVPVVEINWRTYAGDQFPAVLAFARAHGLKITIIEAEEFSLNLSALRKYAEKHDRLPMESVLTGATEEALNAAARAWVTDVMPAVDLQDTDPLELLQYGERMNLQAAIKRVMSPAQVPVAEAMAPIADQPAPVQGLANAGTIGDNDMVGVKGNTMQWKGQIKATAAQMGGRAIWHGASEQWNIPYKAWVRLVENSPQCAQPGQLEMVEFSGKGSYGKRR